MCTPERVQNRPVFSPPCRLRDSQKQVASTWGGGCQQQLEREEVGRNSYLQLLKRIFLKYPQIEVYYIYIYIYIYI